MLPKSCAIPRRYVEERTACDGARTILCLWGGLGLLLQFSVPSSGPLALTMIMLIISALAPTTALIGTQARTRVIAEVAAGRGDM